MLKRYLILAVCALTACPSVFAKGKIKTEFGDSTKTHVFTLSGELMTRGECIKGALPNTTCLVPLSSFAMRLHAY